MILISVSLCFSPSRSVEFFWTIMMWACITVCAAIHHSSGNTSENHSHKKYSAIKNCLLYLQFIYSTKFLLMKIVCSVQFLILSIVPFSFSSICTISPRGSENGLPRKEFPVNSAIVYDKNSKWIIQVRHL